MALEPYLELPHLLSLSWLAYPILSLIFIAFRLLLSLSSAQEDISTAKRTLLASCLAAEKAATTTASLPRYMAVRTNDLYSDMVNASFDGARVALTMTLTAMEEIINFIVDVYRSTLLCFVELVIRGALAIVISALDEADELVKSTASALATTIQAAVDAVNDSINKVISVINDLGGDISDISLDVNLTSLTNLTLPTTFQDALTSLNDSIPTFTALKEAINEVLDTPFELVKTDINDTFAGLSVNATLFTVPAQRTVTFCGDPSNSSSLMGEIDVVVDELGTALIKITKIGIVILILLALLLVAGNCLLTWYRYRSMQRHLTYTRESWETIAGKRGPVTLTDHNLRLLQASCEHPLLTRLSTLIPMSRAVRTRTSFFLYFVSHPPALMCLLIGLAGIISVEVQLALVHPLQAEVTKQSAGMTTSIENSIYSAVNSTMYEQSAEYANSVNTVISDVQDKIDDGLFGWIDNTTATLNDTLSTFYSEIQTLVNDVFNGTVLESPVDTFLYCIIGSKVERIEEALTWLHDNLKINVTLVSDDVLVLNKTYVDEAVTPIAQAAVGTTSTSSISTRATTNSTSSADDDESLLEEIITAYVASLKKERIMFAIFLALWCFVAFMAVFFIMWDTHGRDAWAAWRTRRGRARWMREQRAGQEDVGTVTPFPMRSLSSKKGQVSSNEKPTDPAPAYNDLPEFTPLPSPGARRGSFNPFARFKSESGEDVERVSVAASGPSNQSRVQYAGEVHPGSGTFGEDQEQESRPGVFARLRTLFPFKKRRAGDGDGEEGRWINGDARNVPAQSRAMPADAERPVKSPTSQHSDTSSTLSQRRAGPHLKISVGRADALRPRSRAENEAENEPVSHWSDSPQTAATRRGAPWRRVLSPPGKHSTTMSQVRLLPFRKNRGESTVTTGTPAHLAVLESYADAGPTPPYTEHPTYAPPLHLSFAPPPSLPALPPRPQQSLPERAVFKPPVAGVSDARHRRSASFPLGSPPRSAATPNDAVVLAPTFVLNTPDDLGGRAFSGNGTPATGASTPGYTPSPGYTPTTAEGGLLDPSKLLLPHPSRRASLDPFITPFDDEHRVSIHASNPRKSLQTRPMAASSARVDIPPTPANPFADVTSIATDTRGPFADPPNPFVDPKDPFVGAGTAM